MKEKRNIIKDDMYNYSDLPFNTSSLEIDNEVNKKYEELIICDELKRVEEYLNTNKISMNKYLCGCFELMLNFWINSKNGIYFLQTDQGGCIRKTFKHVTGKYSVRDYVTDVYFEDVGESLSIEVSGYNNYPLLCIGAADEKIKKLFPLIFNIKKNKDYVISVEYDGYEQFSSITMKNMVGQFKQLFVDVNSKDVWSDTLLLSEYDRNFIDSYNQTFKELPKTNIKDMLVDSFQRNSGCIAVTDGKRNILYYELDDLSDKVVKKLKDAGVVPGDVIAVNAHKTIETIADIIAIFKMKCIYVPILPSYPQKRIEFIFRNCNCRFLFDDNSLRTVNTYNSKINIVDSIEPLNDQSAYIIYTSGSTGTPKGVVISNDAACNTLIDINQRFEITKDDIVIGLSSFSFDLSIYDILGTFQSGAKLVLVKDQRDISDVISILDSQAITVWNSVPAIMNFVICSLNSEVKYNNVKKVLLSGDKIDVKLPGKIKKHFPNAKIYSLGGATEASIWSIYYPIKEDIKYYKSVPYGMPLSNQTITIRKDDLSLCAPNVKGEICIGGRGVAQGYINDKDKTEKAFCKTENGIIYKTGDYGILRYDGFVEFCGRIDNQIKLNGYRIEINEIEIAAMHCEGVDSSYVFFYISEDSTTKMLALFYVSKANVLEKKLEQDLSKILPDYMIPHFIMKTQKIPLTGNGKPDKVAMSKYIQEVINKDEEETDFNDFEKKVSNIWKSVLNVKSINRNTDFFACGGDSLKAMRIFEELKHQNIISNDIPIKIMFELSRFSDLINYLRDQKSCLEVIDEEIEEGEI